MENEETVKGLMAWKEHNGHLMPPDKRKLLADTIIALSRIAPSHTASSAFMFEAACSGLRYTGPDACGEVAAIWVNNVRYSVCACTPAKSKVPRAGMKTAADYSLYECPFSHLEKECGHELKGPEGFADTFGVWCACGFRGPVFYLDPEELGLKKKGAAPLPQGNPALWCKCAKESPGADGLCTVCGQQCSSQHIAAAKRCVCNVFPKFKNMICDKPYNDDGGKEAYCQNRVMAGQRCSHDRACHAEARCNG